MRTHSKLMRRLRIILDGPGREEGKLYGLDISNAATQYFRLPNELAILPLNEARCSDLAAFRDASVIKAFRQMLSKGQCCVIAYWAGVPVGHAACIIPPAMEGAFIVNKSAYIHYCHVAPQYRGKGIYPHMLAAMMRYAQAEHATDYFSITTAPDNIASQRGIEKAGFSFVKNYYTFRWWRLQWHRIKV